MTQNGGQIVVHDERHGFAQETIALIGAEAALLDMCWQVTSWRAVREALSARFSRDELESAAEALDARGWMVLEGEHLLALPLRQPGFRRAPSWPELREGQIRPFGDTGIMDEGAPRAGASASRLSETAH